MDASDDDGVRFEDAHDFFSFGGDRRDPFELSFSGTLKNLQSFVAPTTDYPEDEENLGYSNGPFKELVDTMVVPNIKLLIQSGKDGHASLINTTVGMQPFELIFLIYSCRVKYCRMIWFEIIADFLEHAEQNRPAPSDHQVAVIENSNHLQKLCYHLTTHKQSILGSLGPIEAKVR